jgi:endonuclease IV
LKAVKNIVSRSSVAISNDALVKTSSKAHDTRKSNVDVLIHKPYLIRALCPHVRSLFAYSAP